MQKTKYQVHKSRVEMKTRRKLVGRNRHEKDRQNIASKRGAC